MPKLRFSAAAKDDIDSIAEYIANESGSRKVAERFAAALRNKCLDLARAPIQMGRSRPSIARQCPGRSRGLRCPSAVMYVPGAIAPFLSPIFARPCLCPSSVQAAVRHRVGRGRRHLRRDRGVHDCHPGQWSKLTLRWAVFFVGLALLNEIVWRTQTTDIWVSFKVFGVLPLTFLFAASQIPLMSRYAVSETERQEPSA